MCGRGSFEPTALASFSGVLFVGLRCRSSRVIVDWFLVSVIGDKTPFFSTTLKVKRLKRLSARTAGTISGSLEFQVVPAGA